MGEILLGILWVAAHHKMRREGAEDRAYHFPRLDSLERRYRCWGWIHDVTAALGNPPAPGGPR